MWLIKYNIIILNNIIEKSSYNTDISNKDTPESIDKTTKNKNKVGKNERYNILKKFDWNQIDNDK